MGFSPSSRIQPSSAAPWQGLSTAGFGLSRRQMQTGRLPGESLLQHLQAKPLGLGEKSLAGGVSLLKALPRPREGVAAA